MYDIQFVKIEIYTPLEYVNVFCDALHKLGACKVGAYDHVVSYHESHGYWRPLPNSHPYDGEIDKLSFGTEIKMEVRCPIALVKQAQELIRELHPYEEPLINFIPLFSL